MQAKLIIPGPLPGLNEYIKAERGTQYGRYQAARIKRDTEKVICQAILSQIPNVRFVVPVFMAYAWYEPSRRRDKDNIAFAKKFIQDALVGSGVLENDTWKHIDRFEDNFVLDPHNPRVEVVIMEAKGVPLQDSLFTNQLKEC